jgi:dGTPase
VAQIGRSICHFLRTLGEPLSDSFFLDPDLVEAVCLAHDLGHPPFGHAGERALRRVMDPWGGFEGNAQTLRILTGAMYEDGSGARGMQPTRALLDGVLKYKTCFGQYRRPPANHFLYDDQADVVRFVMGGAKVPRALTPGPRLNAFRSLECQIMDWADDIAYSLHDIVDGVKTGTLTRDALERWGERTKPDTEGAGLLHALLRAVRDGTVEGVFSQRIGALITACSLRERDGFLSGKTNRHRFELAIRPGARRLVRFYKRIAGDVIFAGSRIRQLERRANEVVGALWRSEAGRRGGSGTLPPAVAARLRKARGEARKARARCDWIAGLTDAGALRIHAGWQSA